MSRGFDGFDINDFRDPQWESERYRLAGNQAREEAAVHSLEAPSDPNWKTYFSGWRLTPKFTFSVFRCSVYVEGFFSFRLVEIFCANIHQLSHPAERRRAGGEGRARPIEVMRVGVLLAREYAWPGF